MSPVFHLTAGPHRIRLEYREATSSAYLHLYWAGPGVGFGSSLATSWPPASPSLGKACCSRQPVPPERPSGSKDEVAAALGTTPGEVTLEGPQGRRTVDARPSDAINLALLLGVSIRVDPGVLEECARSGHRVIPDRDYPDGAERIAADAVALITSWASRSRRPTA